MKSYESRLKVKTSIDQMQIDFECCGSTNYKDWWKVGWWGVRWLDTNSPEVSRCGGWGARWYAQAPTGGRLNDPT